MGGELLDEAYGVGEEQIGETATGLGEAELSDRRGGD